MIVYNHPDTPNTIGIDDDPQMRVQPTKDELETENKKPLYQDILLEE